MLKPLLIAAVVATGLSVGATSVSAAVLDGFTMTGSGTGNDCPGTFGTDGFESCTVSSSPVIAKFGFNDGVADGVEINSSVFPSIIGNEWSIDPTGSWTYTPGANDPWITAFSIKAGRGWELYETNLPAVFGSQQGSTFSLESLNAALSHIVFYDTQVPIPGAILLFLSALAGLLGLKRLRMNGGPVAAGA